MSQSIDKREIENFSKDAAHWWDADGPFKPLHRLNPVRISYIKQQICDHYDRDMQTLDSLKGLEIIDIGCGGGLVCEPLARLGGTVTGADADPVAIDVAAEHAAQQDLDITYVNSPAEDIDKQYDVVLALEIIEHVTEPEDFVESVAKLCKPGGLVIISTLNRTAKSFALGIVAAEYILRWVPAGTHRWKKFVKPSELARHARTANLKPHNVSGLIFNPLKNKFALSSSDLDVNYLMSMVKA